MAIVRKEQMPATIAPERFQAWESFDGSAANGLAPSSARAVIHPVFMLVKIIDFFLHRFRRCSRWQFRQNLFQLLHDFDG